MAPQSGATSGPLKGSRPLPPPQSGATGAACGATGAGISEMLLFSTALSKLKYTAAVGHGDAFSLPLNGYHAPHRHNNRPELPDRLDPDRHYRGKTGPRNRYPPARKRQRRRDQRDPGSGLESRRFCHTYRHGKGALCHDGTRPAHVRTYPVRQQHSV